MFPILIDLAAIPVALVGNGEPTVRRLELLREGGAQKVYVFSTQPSSELLDATGGEIQARLPTDEDLLEVRLMFVADLDEVSAAELAVRANQANVLVNVEDNGTLSDFHVPAILRRGDLTLTVSTSGISPGLARILKRALERDFSEDWAERLTEVGQWRKGWREEGLDPDEVSARTEAALHERGWLR